jgi:phage gp29-like protein
VLGTRKRSVAQLDITGRRRVGRCRATSARRHGARLARTRDELQDELFDMLDAIGKGVSFTEIVWDTSEGQWRPARLEWRDPRWFEASIKRATA